MPTAHGDAENLAVTTQTLSWQAYTASAVGAGHVRDGRPNQDAVGQKLATRPDGSRVHVVAVADGHGDARHFRSERGARMAVAAGIAAVLDWSPAILGDAAAIRRSAEQMLVPDVVTRWNAAVTADLSEDPFSEAERALHAELGLTSETAYGSTLLIVVLTAEFAVFAQIGDGDIVAALPDGRSLSPVPQDDRLDGWRTTSLCQPGAAAAFRAGVVRLAGHPLAAVLAATDGFGNAQAEYPWQPGVAADLASFGAEHDEGWFARQVPSWAAQCASSAGSGDDATLALVMNPAVLLNPALPRQEGQLGRPSEPGPTLPGPAVPGRTLGLFPQTAEQAGRKDLPQDDLGRQEARGTARASRATRLRSLTPAAAAVVAVLAALALAYFLLGPGRGQGPPRSHPTHRVTHQPSPGPSGSLTPSPSPDHRIPGPRQPLAAVRIPARAGRGADMARSDRPGLNSAPTLALRPSQQDGRTKPS